MSDLGTLDWHQPRPSRRVTDGNQHLRTIATHRTGRAYHREAFEAIHYPSEWARYNARINGREAHLVGRSDERAAWPFPSGASPLTDENGLIIYHPLEIQIRWYATAGSRTLAVAVRHHTASDRKPQVKIAAPAAMGITDQIVTATGASDTADNITINCEPITAGLINVTLINRDNGENARVTWGAITTT
jgi:hypothetical protein